MNYTVSFRGRITSPSTQEPGEAFLHCMSRVVGGAHLLKTKEKEVFRRMMRQQAAFSGVEVLTYAIMSNHFHLLLRVDPRTEVSDAELLERIRLRYGAAKTRVIHNWLNDPHKGPRIRERLLTRMHDVSFFLKELKQRFTLWFNRKHERFGTLWAEKFKSVLVEGDPEVLMRVAGYIDLNPIRAKLCSDPKDYRFCGYAEAVGGQPEARDGLRKVYHSEDWTDIQRRYRLLLFGKGYHSDLHQGRIAEGDLKKAIEDHGELSLSETLRCRIIYFSEGMALGSGEFLERIFRERRRRYWKKRTKSAYSVPGSEYRGLCVLNHVRTSPR